MSGGPDLGSFSVDPIGRSLAAEQSLALFLERARDRFPDALAIPATFVNEFVAAARQGIRRDPDFMPAFAAADALLFRGRNWDYIRAIRDRHPGPDVLVAAPLREELEGYVDTAAVFTAISTVGTRASEHDLLSVLERSPYLSSDRFVAPWLRERAKASLKKRSSWALKTASGEEFLDPEPFLSACAQIAETEGKTSSYVHGARTARDTVLILKHLLETFLIAP